MCDDFRADGQYPGWADLLAAALAREAGTKAGGSVEYANLAIRGKLLDLVVADQLPLAMGYRPQVLTFHAGPNDVLRKGTDLPDLFRRYEAAVAVARGAADRLVVFTAIPRAGGTGRVAAILAARIGAFKRPCATSRVGTKRYWWTWATSRRSPIAGCGRRIAST